VIDDAEPQMRGYEVRLLSPDDQPALEQFLLTHADTSLFLRSFVSRGGLVDEGQLVHGTYAAAIRRGEVVGVAMHARAGWLVVQAPEATVEVARHAVEATQRAIIAIVGPWTQAESARIGLGLSGRGLQKHACEDLFALDLSDLITPPQLTARGVRYRRSEKGDLGRLRSWRFYYEMESTGLANNQETRDIAAKAIEGHVERQEAFLLEVGGQPVSTCTFNAQAADMVQVGGVWTPPGLRGRGYGRMVVAGALKLGEQEGVKRAVLYTEDAMARRAYEALCFKRIGDYGVVVFAP
jgi:predicted GNAT family acetyltransferase